MDYTMKRLMRQMLSFAQGYKSDFDFDTIANYTNEINKTKIEHRDQEAALKYLVHDGCFKDLGNGKYEILPLTYEFISFTINEKEEEVENMYRETAHEANKQSIRTGKFSLANIVMGIIISLLLLLLGYLTYIKY